MDHRDELGSAILRSKPARSQVLTSLDLNAVHNQSATATARTQAGDRQSRKVAIDPRILLTDRLRDEHGRHSGASYYRPAGLLTFFFDLLRLADAGGIVYGIESLLAKSPLLRELDRSSPSDTSTCKAKLTWNRAWSMTSATSFPAITASAPNGSQYAVKTVVGREYRYLADADLWESNAKYAIRFSAGHLRPVYEQFLAGKGIVEIDGSRVVLPPTLIPAGTYFE